MNEEGEISPKRNGGTWDDKNHVDNECNKGGEMKMETEIRLYVNVKKEDRKK